MTFRQLFLGAALGALTLAPVTARADSPEHFLRQAIAGDNSEIMLGQLAVRQAGSQAVRNYGQTLDRDHRKALMEVSRVAQRQGVTPDAIPSEEASHERDHLRGLPGPQFDREFVRYMIDDHRKDISDFQDEAKQGGPVGRLAARQLPVLRKHLNIALSIQRGFDHRMASGDRSDRDR